MADPLPPPGEKTPMIGAQPPAVSINYVQPEPTTTTIVSATCVFTVFPVAVTCPTCHACVHTRTTFTAGALTWIICIVICLFGGFLGCCLIPFCLDICQDVIHSCPNCNTVIGKYKRI